MSFEFIRSPPKLGVRIIVFSNKVTNFTLLPHRNGKRLILKVKPISMFEKKSKYLFTLLVLTLLLSDCNESSVEPDRIAASQKKAEIVNRSLQEQYDYVNGNLSVIAKALLPLTKDSDFRQLLYSEVKKQFDGDENVLLQELLKLEPGLLDKLVASRYLSDPNALAESLDAFNGIGAGRERLSLFPQIYIHNFFELEANGFSTPNPTIVIFNGDGSQTIFEGLRLNSDHETEKIKVDESFAIENEVWVLSLNDNYRGEEIEEFKTAVAGRSKFTGDCISTPTCDRTSTDWAHIQLNKLAIDCQWETWAQGNADVAIALGMAYQDGINPNTQQYQQPHYVGGEAGYDYLLSVDNSEIGRCYDMIYTAFYGANPVDNIAHPSGEIGDILFYTIFEHDNWPVPIRTQNVVYQKHTYPVTNYIVQLRFRGDGPYFYNSIAARFLTSNCSYFGCLYFGNHACDQYNSSNCGEVNWKTGS